MGRRRAHVPSPVVVLDANVAPGLIGYRRVPPKQAVSTACVQAARAGDIQLAFSAPWLEEVLDVLQRPPFSLTYRTARRNLGLLERGARIVRITGRLGALRQDPAHNDVQETAIAARASFLVTWNVRDYEELGRDADGRLRYRGVEVVEPGEMLRVVRQKIL